MDFISAGDIEKYSYCPLSWWLSREERNERSEGVKKHEEFNREVKRMRSTYQRAKSSENIVIYYSIGATIIALLSISFLYTSLLLSRLFIVFSLLWLLFSLYFLWRYDKYVLVWNKKVTERVMVVGALIATVFSILAMTFLVSNYIFGYVLVILSLLWLIFATYFLHMALKSEIQYNEIRNRIKLPDGEVIYVDDMETSPLLKSERYGIWGRPDLVLKVRDDYIPMEVKTGRIPKGPLFSHIMQLTAYMLLVEENYGTPPYGILKYGPVVYKIEYEEALKELLLEKVKEMRDAMRRGEVHRNHNKVGKCLHCSRRDVCPERLA